MSYLVLARKYRPRNFGEMVGQEHVVQALTNALTRQRLHHAYLFTGTRGVGKTTVARILAKSLNCQGADGQGTITAAPCGVCQACADIDSGRFVDYTELDAASNRGVDEVQGLLEQAVYKPVQGRFKVFMIDEVHMLTNQAFNAMLKTLEEPPEYLKFVLATTDPQKVPVTVLSRCLQFNLRPMAPETVAAHLAQVLTAENMAFEPRALRLLARAARGSMRDALSLADQAIAFGAGQLQEEAVRQMLGAVDRTYVLRLIAALAQGDGRALVETSEALRRNGLSAASTLEEMSAVLQRMAVFQAVPQLAQAAAAAAADDPEAASTARLAAAMPADETQLAYSLCLHGRADLGLAPDEYAALTMVLLRLLAFKPAGARAPAGALPDAGAGAAAAGAGGAAEDVAPPVAASGAESTVASAPVPASASAPESAPAPVASELAPAPVSAPAPALASAPAPGSTPVPAFAAMVTPAQPRSAPVHMSATVLQTGPPGANPVPAPHAAEARATFDLTAGSATAAAPANTALPPPGQAAPQTSHQAPKPPDVQIKPGHDATEFVAIPVRTTPEPGARLQPAPHSASAPASAHYSATEEGALWHAAVQQLVAADAIGALARELALQSQLVARDGAHWLLRVERESLNQAAARERLRAALEAAGHASQISVELGMVSDSPARRNAAAAEQRQRRAQAIVDSDPYVQALMREHGAKIVPGSVRPA